jgi:hypothetical protein
MRSKPAKAKRDRGGERSYLSFRLGSLGEAFKADFLDAYRLYRLKQS